MALGKKKAKQIPFWVETTQLQAHTQHPFYSRVNEILEKANFDRYAERICRKYYAERMGRPSITPGTYFRCFFIGYFEGIDSERGIAYRVSDSLGLREFLGLSLEGVRPHSPRRYCDDRWQSRKRKSKCLPPRRLSFSPG